MRTRDFCLYVHSMNRTYTYLRNDRKTKFRMVSAQHYINEAPGVPSRRLSMGDSHQEGPLLSGGGHDPSPPPGVVEIVGVAPEGAQLIASGLSTEVVGTILQSRAPSTRKQFALKWKLFTSWCGNHQLDAVNCPVGSVLEFLQARLSAGLTYSTLKVYVAAIAAYHAPLGGQSVGKQPLVTRFHRGALRPPVCSRVPPWDLAMVSEALCNHLLTLSRRSPIVFWQDCFPPCYLFSQESWRLTGPLSGPLLSRLCARYGQSFSVPQTLVRA